MSSVDEYAFGSPATPLAQSLTRLNLNNNELTHVELAFVSQLPNLKELLLDYNKLQHLPENVFAGASRSLEHLSLRGNFIARLSAEHALAGLHHNLRRLDLAGNGLRHVAPRLFMHTTKLRELNMERNELGALTDARGLFEGVESELRTLNMEHNQLRAAHLWSLAGLLNVESLRVGHNPLGADIDSLSRVFELFRNMSHLDLQNSSLRRVPYFAGLNRTLLTLNVASNRVCHVSERSLARSYARLRRLNLNGNPLRCDCNLSGLRHWLLDKMDAGQEEVVAANTSTLRRDTPLNWRCASPQPLLNRPLTQVSAENLVCESTNRRGEDVNLDDECLLDVDETLTSTTTATTTTTTTTTASILITQPRVIKKKLEYSNPPIELVVLFTK